MCAFLSGTVCLAWLAVRDISGVINFTVLYGSFSGALMSLPSAVFPYVSPEFLGNRMGMAWVWALAGIALLVGSPIAAPLVDLRSENSVRLQGFRRITLSVGACLQIPLWWLIRRKIAAA